MNTLNRKQKKTLVRILISALLVILLTVSPLHGIFRSLLFLIPYLIVGYDILKKAIKGICNHQPFDENLLMAIATIGALALGDFLEATAVMLFYQVGELFQSYAVNRSRRNISDLMDIRPDYANLEDSEGNIDKVDPDDVEVGSIIIVRPGEKIPIDGIIQEGATTLDMAALTGESLPREAREGDEVLSGSINLTGLLRIETTQEFEESTASKILDLVENASSRKSKSEAFITRFARVYTPAVCFSALALAILPPIIRIFALQASPEWNIWVYRALTFLVISCPCALVVSIPLSFFAGIGGASHEGILIKGSNFMESLASAGTVVFDKTGTLTEGSFRVKEIYTSGISEDELLRFAAYTESSSNHPISRSIVSEFGKPIDSDQIQSVQEETGYGITAEISGNQVAIGNDRLMQQLNISYTACDKAGTVVYIAVNQKFAGYILIGDSVKPNAARAIQVLKERGIRKTVMLTGDRQEAAEEVASSVGIDEVHSHLLPADKLAIVESLLEHRADGNVVFVGDGINDAPVLTRADIGIAMGALGSDAAIEAADIVLMDDDPLKAAKAIAICKKCIRIVRQNTVFAIGVKLICLILGAVGIANMWYAIFADVGVMVIAVLNAVRALSVRKL